MARHTAHPLAPIVAANLNRVIEERGLTNRQVADLVGTTEQQVWRWRHAKMPPSSGYALALAQELFEGDLAALYVAESNGKAA